MHLSKLNYLIQKINPTFLLESSIHPLKIKKEEEGERKRNLQHRANILLLGVSTSSLSKPRSRRKGAPEQAHPARISSG